MIVWGGNSISGYANSGGILWGPYSPGNTLLVSKSSAIDLSWSLAADASSYHVRRCQPALVACIPVSIIAFPVVTAYSESEDGVSHFYSVDAVNAARNRSEVSSGKRP